MWKKLEAIEQAFDDLEAQLSDPNLVADQKRYREVVKRHAELNEISGVVKQHRQLQQELQDTREMLQGDDDMVALAQEEIQSLTEKIKENEKQLKVLLVPRDPNDNKNVFMEIRAGTGGEEAALFAADLFRVYTRYAENQGWKLSVIDSNATGLQGLKEIIFQITGKDVFRAMKFEAGVHRVQRVPATEASGRIHTSAVTVVVLPEADEVEVSINPSELRIDIFCSSGPGGQSVNTTYSAVRITHLPTGMVVQCQDERSQIKNKAKAMKVLQARLKKLKEDEQSKELSADRKSQVGSGDRSEKIRTYNYPQNRVTDHRINYSNYNLEGYMNGEIGDIIQKCQEADHAERMAASI